jgi:hypothetical protein
MREGKFFKPTFTKGEDGVTVIGSTLEERWPEVVVTSYQFGQLPIHERLRQMAHGYIASSRSLTVELGENPERLDWPRASAACFCFHHSIELFLKACILFKCPNENIGYHSLPKLTDRYYELFPFDKFFAFQAPWIDSPREIAHSLGGDIDIEDFEEKNDQVFRYLSDKEGRSPKARHGFAPGVWLSMMEHFEETMRRVWDNILETIAAK